MAVGSSEGSKVEAGDGAMDGATLGSLVGLRVGFTERAKVVVVHVGARLGSLVIPMVG